MSAPASYTADNPNLIFCTVCRHYYDPTPEGFCTFWCPGCDPDAPQRGEAVGE